MRSPRIVRYVRTARPRAIAPPNGTSAWRAWMRTLHLATSTAASGGTDARGSNGPDRSPHDLRDLDLVRTGADRQHSSMPLEACVCVSGRYARRQRGTAGAAAARRMEAKLKVRTLFGFSSGGVLYMWRRRSGAALVEPSCISLPNADVPAATAVRAHAASPRTCRSAEGPTSSRWCSSQESGRSHGSHATRRFRSRRMPRPGSHTQGADARGQRPRDKRHGARRVTPST